MCQNVFRGPETYATPRELTALVGSPDHLAWREREGEMDWCLCAIDLPRTLDRAGLKWRRDGDPMSFHVDD